MGNYNCINEEEDIWDSNVCPYCSKSISYGIDSIETNPIVFFNFYVGKQACEVLESDIVSGQSRIKSQTLSSL